MPAYNAAGYIEATLDTVFQQTFEDWELLVIDDCSTDTTLQMLKEYEQRDPRVKIIKLEKNMGAPAGPRNIGIQQAQGNWIAFLDSDDLWHPEKLKLQLATLEKTGAKFCSTQMIDFHGSEKPKLRDTTTDQIEWISFLKQLIKFRTPTSSVIADRELLLNHTFNESMEYKAREDLDCWLHCHEEVGRSVKIKAPMMGYRIIKGQISGKKWTMFKRHLHVLRNYRSASGKLLPYPKALFFTCTHFLLAFYYRYAKGGL